MKSFHWSDEVLSLLEWDFQILGLAVANVDGFLRRHPGISSRFGHCFIGRKKNEC